MTTSDLQATLEAAEKRAEAAEGENERLRILALAAQGHVGAPMRVTVGRAPKGGGSAPARAVSPDELRAHQAQGGES